MSDFETEDQELEAFKHWWKENGKFVIFGAIFGFSAIFGGKAYMDHLEVQRMKASIAFEMMSVAGPEMLAAQGEKIVSNYPGTPYAALASLALAKQHVDNDELAAAQNRLQWVLDNEEQADILHIARLRLARVLLADAKLDQAKTLLTNVEMESYTPIYEELRGDIYLAQQQPGAARAAYVAAMAALAADDDRQLLQMKIDDLGA